MLNQIIITRILFKNYDFPVKYTNKSFEDFLGPTIFYSMAYEFKKNTIMGDTMNIKIIYSIHIFISVIEEERFVYEKSIQFFLIYLFVNVMLY